MTLRANNLTERDRSRAFKETLIYLRRQVGA